MFLIESLNASKRCTPNQELVFSRYRAATLRVTTFSWRRVEKIHLIFHLFVSMQVKFN